MNSYRVHYKKGDIEVEVESTDKDYVDQMLQKFLPPQASLPSGRPKPPRTVRKQNKGTEATAIEQETAVDVAAVANAVHDSDNYKEIEKNVLNKGSAFGKILVASHFADELGHEYLTTGDIEKITDQLRVKISKSSASHCIEKHRKYFSTPKARRKGAKVPYKLNRQGEIAYEKYVTGQKVE